MSARNYNIVTIAASGTESNYLDLVNKTIIGIEMPAAFTGTAVTFTSARESGGTYKTLYKDGSNVSITVAASKVISLNPSDFACLGRFMKVVSGSSEAAARDIVVISRVIE